MWPASEVSTLDKFNTSRPYVTYLPSLWTRIHGPPTPSGRRYVLVRGRGFQPQFAGTYNESSLAGSE